MCCIGPEYFSAEAASFDPSDMLTVIFFVLLCDLLNVCVRSSHPFSVSGFPLFSVKICYLLGHALANSNPPYPSLKLGVKNDGAMMYMKVH